MNFNAYTQVRPRATATPSRKKVVYLGSLAKEPAAVKELRKAVDASLKFKTPKGVYIASVN